MAYQIFTDATSDIDLELLNRHPNIEIIPMDVIVDDRKYTYGPYGDLKAEDFYKMLKEGKYARTSQINPEVYMKYFEEKLSQGIDVLYLCFTSGLSGTYNTVSLCAKELAETYPERDVICIDTLCAGPGEGLLVIEAAKRQEEGYTLYELARWVETHKRYMGHWFTVDTLEYLRRGGRISTLAAAAGTVLQIRPLLTVNSEGKLSIVEKCRGAKRTKNALLERFKERWDPGMGDLILVGYSDNRKAAEDLKASVLELAPKAQIHITEIGPVIGSHTGPGFLGFVFWENVSH